MNTQLINKIEKGQLKKVPDIKPGDTVRVHQKITEGKKERIQIFEGVVLKIKGSGLRKSFTCRKISFGVGVERNFKIHSPNIVKIEVKKRAKVRRANLSYLRKLTGKSARLRDKQFDSLVVNVQDETEPEVEKDPSTDAQDGAGVLKEDTKELRDESTEGLKDKETEEVAKNTESEKDKDITELDESEVGDVEAEVPLSEVEKSEEKQAAEAAGDDTEEEGQKSEIEETEEGVEEAEKDLENGKNKKEDFSEKDKERINPKDIKEEK